MATGAEFIRRIVTQSGVLRAKARRDLQRELQTHLEDATEEARAEGYEEGGILPGVCDRFGNPDEIAREFERTYRFERRAIFMADAVGLLSISTLAVAALILTFQLVVALWLGMSPSNAFPRLRGELVAFVSLAVGYMGMYLEERLFQTHRLLKAFAMNSVLYACLFAAASAALSLRTPAPVLAFVSGVAVRLLQRTVFRSFWYLGAIVPTAAACLSAGRLLSTGNEIPLWAAVLVRWVGLTVACYSLTILSRNHEARRRASSAEV